MLLKVKLGDAQKFVKITEPNLTEFLNAGKNHIMLQIQLIIRSNYIDVDTDFCVCFVAFAKFGVPPVTQGVKIIDSSGTEVDEDVFEDIVNDPSTGVLTIKYDTGMCQISNNC